MGELASELRILEALPAWVPEYLAAWGSVRPDGKAMSVEWAAGLAGVSAATVRQLRRRHRQFQTLEYLARHGTADFMASYAEAGVRGAAPAILRSFLRLIEENNATVVTQGMKWLLNRPEEMDITSGGAAIAIREVVVELPVQNEPVADRE